MKLNRQQLRNLIGILNNEITRNNEALIDVKFKSDEEYFSERKRSAETLLDITMTELQNN